MKDIAVLIACKSPSVRTEIEQQLASSKQIRVVGAAEANEDIVVMTAYLRPDVLLLHAPSCGEPRQDLLIRLLRIHVDLKILALECSPEHVRSCFIQLSAWGLRGCICRWPRRGAELIDAVHTVGKGDIYLCPVASHALVDAYRHMIHQLVQEEARA